MITWSDDPVRDAEAYSAAGDAWTERHARGNAHCADCGKLIRDDDAHVLDPDDKMELTVCQECGRKAVKILEAAGLWNIAQMLDDELWLCRAETPNRYDDFFEEMEEK